jgi:hypothetical protein
MMIIGRRCARRPQHHLVSLTMFGFTSARQKPWRCAPSCSCNGRRRSRRKDPVNGRIRKAIWVYRIWFCTQRTRRCIAQRRILIVRNSVHRKSYSNYNLRCITQEFGFAPAEVFPLTLQHRLMSSLTTKKVLQRISWCGLPRQRRPH